MTIPRFDPVAQVVEELGTGKKVIFNSNKALYETPLWIKLFSEAQLTEAYEAGKREQAAQIEMMREALGHALNGLLYYHHAKLVKRGIDVANEALSISPDQALEQFAAKVRSQCESVARSGEWGLTKTGKAIAAAIGRIKDMP